MENFKSKKFAPKAKVSTIMPGNAHNAETQRARWELGRFPLIKKYGKALFVEAVKRKSFRLFDAFIDLVTPAFVNLFVFTIIMIIINSLLEAAGIVGRNDYVFLWIVLLVLQIFHVLGGLSVSKADKDAYKALINVPRYAIWKLLLYVKLFFKGHTGLWIRTTREINP